MSRTLVGQNHMELKDATGTLWMKENIEVVKTKGSGGVNYGWTNPATKKVQPRKSRVRRAEGTNLHTMCGVFR